jgi:hypothetical protein
MNSGTKMEETQRELISTMGFVNFCSSDIITLIKTRWDRHGM